MPGLRACYQRRRILGMAAAAGCGLVFGGTAPALAAIRQQRALSFYNIHTDESIGIVYWAEGRYLQGALTAIDHHLRDFRTGEVRPIDSRLLEILHRLNRHLGNDEPVHVISGYRSPETNAMLAARSTQVSKSSFHMHGMAIDIRVPGVTLADLRTAALDLRAGGVGYYPGPDGDFVHVDTGPVRSW